MFTRLRTAPLAQLDSPQERLFQFLNDWSDWMPRSTTPPFPPVNAWEKDGALHLEASLPGYGIDDLDVSVTRNQLTIAARGNSDDESTSYHRKERRTPSFRRTIDLWFPIDADEISARMIDGILKIELPKAKEALPKTIEVQSARS